MFVWAVAKEEIQRQSSRTHAVFADQSLDLALLEFGRRSIREAGVASCSESIIQINAPASRHSFENEIVGVARIREEHRSGRPLRVVSLVRQILGPDGRRPGLAIDAEPYIQQPDRIAHREV